MREAKITVLGAGSVGVATVRLLTKGQLGEVVLADLAGELARGKAPGRQWKAPAPDPGCRTVGSEDVEVTAGSDVLVVTATAGRRPGTGMDEAWQAHAATVADWVRRTSKHSRDAIIAVATDPVGAMCEVAHRAAGIPRQRIVGILDAGRLRSLIASELGVSTESVAALTLGGGETVVPLPRYAAVAGVPVAKMLPKATVAAIARRAVAASGRGAGCGDVAAAVFEVVDAVVADRKKILPCLAYVEGAFGLSGVWCGVPCKIGAGGVEEIFEVPLTRREMSLLARAAAAANGWTERLPGDPGGA